MSDFSPVAWTEGMFLRPQHMQQQERFLQYQQTHAVNKLNPFAWGVSSFEVNHGLLPLGQFGLDRIECMFQDHTLALLPEQSPLPKAISIPAGTIDQLIYIVLPVSKSNSLNISSEEQNQITRYVFDDHNIVDTSFGSDATEVLQVAKLDCRLKLQSEDRSGYVSIAIARVIDVSDEGVVKLDKKFIPACTGISHIKALQNINTEINGMIQQRADAIAGRLNQSQSASSSIADFLMLQLLNKYQPIFEHYSVVSHVHPETFFCSLLSFSGELATFSSPDKRPPKFPIYQHDNLTYVFSNVMVITNHGLSTVLEQSATEFALEKTKFGVYFATISDKSMLDNADFILAVKANVPSEELRQRLPSQIKIGSVETIRELVNNQLAGIGISTLPIAPRQVPYHAGYHYFQLDKNNSHWVKLKSSGGLAMHISGAYPELQIELWAINT
ncbi:type VI secretion system-associated protein [Shewanella sp. 10N.286.51.B7]|uniref:type VI secretion system baseplate subunit TssK n=1 Tax=Shewanella sp. 10N.286.51.B7 TaxID=1880836 RepID=UPI000C854F80|nr:type VI secretion system baseplate subunit TssK [Shewanella sp. 10N.286.51.B7]PMG75179.1 type VI secretion system-associated protein [Shewanella sp. 10N.286.51.B7]